jgi:hypothetical protein
VSIGDGCECPTGYSGSGQCGVTYGGGGGTESGTGSGDTGSGGTGSGDTGSGDTGSGDTGSGDTGGGDTGSGDTGGGDTGSGDTGGGETGGGSSAESGCIMPNETRGDCGSAELASEDSCVGLGNDWDGTKCVPRPDSGNGSGAGDGGAGDGTGDGGTGSGVTECGGTGQSACPPTSNPGGSGTGTGTGTGSCGGAGQPACAVDDSGFNGKNLDDGFSELDAAEKAREDALKDKGAGLAGEDWGFSLDDWFPSFAPEHVACQNIDLKLGLFRGPLKGLSATSPIEFCDMASGARDYTSWLFYIGGLLYIWRTLIRSNQK